MIQADLIIDGGEEPFASIVFEETPTVGDAISVVEEPFGAPRVVEVTGREWFVRTDRKSPNNLVILNVRDVAATPSSEGAPQS